MQHQYIITIDGHISQDFVLNFLKNINFIKSIKLKKQKKEHDLNIDEVTLLSEKALAEDWLSEEDNRWDKVL